MMETFTNYFEEAEPNLNWIRNLFIAGLESMENDDELKEQLIELKNKVLVKNKVDHKSLGNFWCSQKVIYPGLTKVALLKLVSFATTIM